MNVSADFSFAVTLPNANDAQGIMEIKSVRDIYHDEDEVGTYDAAIILDNGWKISHQMKFDDNAVLMACTGDEEARQSLVKRLAHASEMDALKDAHAEAPPSPKPSAPPTSRPVQPMPHSSKRKKKESRGYGPSGPASCWSQDC